VGNLPPRNANPSPAGLVSPVGRPSGRNPYRIPHAEDFPMFRRFVVTGAAVVAVAAAATWFGELSPASAPAPAKRETPHVADPIVINDCKLNVVDREDVPSQRNGVLDFIGTEVKSDEMVPRHIRTWTVKLGEKDVLIRELKEGDEIREGDLLGRL